MAGSAPAKVFARCWNPYPFLCVASHDRSPGEATVVSMHKASIYALVGVGATSVVALGLTPVAPAQPAAADGLAPFSSCDDLRDWYVSRALTKVTAWGLGNEYPYFAADAVATGSRLESANLYGAEEAPASETGTNVQEAGVDEPDIAKSDGEVAAVVDGRSVRLYDVSGGGAIELSTIQLGPRDGSAELLLVDDTLVVLQQGLAASSWGGSAATVDSLYAIPQGTPTTTISVFDVTDPREPLLASTNELDAGMVTAREHDGVVRLVVRHQPNLDFAHPYDRMFNGGPWRESEEKALAHNREVLRESVAADWVPTITDSAGVSRPLVGCDEVRHPTAEATALGSISIVTFDPVAEPDSNNEWESTSVTAEGNLVYASMDRLYVGHSDANQWWTSSRTGSTTGIHAFDISGGSTTYVASGSVDGVVPDRWAMSEDTGFLRVAATTSRNWSPEETHVVVLEEQAGALTQIGEVGGIGEREDIQAVRWFGDLAIVVTFRQVDPLYTVDLSDPAAPRVLGELKIPGFSAYLHPVGSDVVLGVGQAGTQGGNLLGAAASTFDLGNLALPKQIATLRLGERYSNSAVEDDSRAFTYLPEVRVALVPVWDRDGQHIVALSVSADGELTKLSEYNVGRSGSVRALTLGDQRVAIVAGGEIERIASFV